VKLP
jgi:hypothetical protein